jgi:hydroxyethylthiazole kinase-like sugar kinase family protein
MNRPLLAHRQRLSTIAPRLATAGRVIVYLVMVRVVFVVWQNGSEPFNVLVLVVPGVLFLIDGDLREFVVGAGPAAMSRVKATGCVALAAAASATGIAGAAQLHLSYPFVRPIAVAVTLSTAALIAQSIRRTTDSLKPGIEQ